MLNIVLLSDFFIKKKNYVKVLPLALNHNKLVSNLKVWSSSPEKYV